MGDEKVTNYGNLT